MQRRRPRRSPGVAPDPAHPGAGRQPGGDDDRHADRPAARALAAADRLGRPSVRRGRHADRARRRPPRPGAARAADARRSWPPCAATSRRSSGCCCAPTPPPSPGASPPCSTRCRAAGAWTNLKARPGLVACPAAAAPAASRCRRRRDRAAPTAPGRSSSCCGGCARATCAEPGRPRAQAGGWSALPGRPAARRPQEACTAIRVRPCTP